MNGFDLDDRCALVTGASRGIGRAIALDLAAAGAAVAVNYLHSGEKALEVVNRITADGGRALAVQADTSDAAQVDRMFETVMKDFGRLDILVNNAGVVSWVDFLELPEAEWDRVIDTNLKGYFLCGQRAARIMAKAGGGRIVNVSSISQAVPGLGRVHYGASKGGIMMLTKGMALDLAQHGITVNAVGPGATETDFTSSVLSDPESRKRVIANIPLGRVARPEDITGAVRLLVSDRGAYITGQTIYIEGGYMF